MWSGAVWVKAGWKRGRVRSIPWPSGPPFHLMWWSSPWGWICPSQGLLHFKTCRFWSHRAEIDTWGWGGANRRRRGWRLNLVLCRAKNWLWFFRRQCTTLVKMTGTGCTNRLESGVLGFWFTLDSGTEYLEMESNLSTPGPVCKYKSWQPSSTQLSRRFPKFLYRFIDNEFLFRYSVSFSSQSEHVKLFTAPWFSHNWLETCRSICHVELKTPFWGRPHSDSHASQSPSDNCSISGAVPKILSSCSWRICQDMLWGWWNFHKALKQSNRNYWYASWDESKYGILCIEKMQGCNHPHTTYNIQQVPPIIRYDQIVHPNVYILDSALLHYTTLFVWQKVFKVHF